MPSPDTVRFSLPGNTPADGIGNVYVDDEPEPDPSYQTLPAFWTAEIADVTALPPASASGKGLEDV